MSRPNCRKTFNIGETLPEEGLTILGACPKDPQSGLMFLSHTRRPSFESLAEKWCLADHGMEGDFISFIVRQVNCCCTSQSLTVTWKYCSQAQFWWLASAVSDDVWRPLAGSFFSPSMSKWAEGLRTVLTTIQLNYSLLWVSNGLPQVAALPVPASGLGEQKLACLSWRSSTQSAAFSYRC